MNKTEGEPGHSRMFTNTNNMIKISKKNRENKQREQEFCEFESSSWA